MPSWSKGRIALLGDACGALTLISGQGSHMAMGGAYIIARELEMQRGNYPGSFHAYEAFLKPSVRKRQDSAARFVNIFIPPACTPFWLRRIALKLLFSGALIRFMPAYFGSKSLLNKY